MHYGIIEKFAGRGLAASLYWNGAAFRARLKNPDARYGCRREGYGLWADAVTRLKDAKNVDNAKKFMNFIMHPENAVLLLEFAPYVNSIRGSEKYLPADVATATEIVVADEFESAGTFYPTCPPEAQKMYTAIWTELQK